MGVCLTPRGRALHARVLKPISSIIPPRVTSITITVALLHRPSAMLDYIIRQDQLHQLGHAWHALLLSRFQLITTGLLPLTRRLPVHMLQRQNVLLVKTTQTRQIQQQERVLHALALFLQESTILRQQRPWRVVSLQTGPSALPLAWVIRTLLPHLQALALLVQPLQQVATTLPVQIIRSIAFHRRAQTLPVRLGSTLAAALGPRLEHVQIALKQLQVRHTPLGVVSTMAVQLLDALRVVPLTSMYQDVESPIPLSLVKNAQTPLQTSTM